MIDQVLTTLNANDYADIVRKHYARQLLLSAANEIARLSYTNELSVSEMIAGASETLRKVSEQVSAPG